MSQSCTTSECGTSSSTMSSLYDAALLKTSDNQARLATTKGCFNPREITTYSLDTLLISYRPRVIALGSDGCRYRTLNDVLSSLEPYKGGYVVYLPDGCHQIDCSFINTTDRLTLVGDLCPSVGASYLHGVPQSAGSIPYVASDRAAGGGYFTLTVYGRQVTVTGSVASPCFNDVRRGQRAGIVLSNQKIVDAEVECAKDNTVTFKGAVPIESPQPLYGEGFFLYPNVTIESTAPGLTLRTTDSIVYKGIGVRCAYPFYTGGTSGTLDVQNCLVYNMTMFGPYAINGPNTCVGVMVVSTQSTGMATRTVFAGLEARLTIDGASSSAWENCTFANTTVGCRIINNGKASLYGTSFVNNCLGLQVHAQSSASIQGTVYYGNRVGVSAFYNSTVSSYTVEGSPEELSRPVFAYNFVQVQVGYQSYALVPNAAVVYDSSTQHLAIVDNKFRTTIESNSVGDPGTKGSMVLVTNNPEAPDKLEQMDCGGTGNSCYSTLAGTYEGFTGGIATSTYSTIAASCASGSGSVSGTATPTGVGTFTGVAGSAFGQSCGTLPPAYAAPQSGYQSILAPRRSTALPPSTSVPSFQPVPSVPSVRSVPAASYPAVRMVSTSQGMMTVQQPVSGTVQTNVQTNVQSTLPPSAFQSASFPQVSYPSQASGARYYQQPGPCSSCG